MTAVLLAFTTFVSTILGGLFAFKNQRYLPHILGLSAGIILGVVAFDILPEIFGLLKIENLDPIFPMIGLVVGFLIFHILEKSILLHHSHEAEYVQHQHPQVGLLSAFALSAHSFLDGVSIGLGFQVNPGVGVAVTIAVVAHDFADGLNTVTLMLAHKNTRRRAFWLLILDATAPILGAISTLFFTLAPNQLAIYLGFFAGFLLYIGASDILPQAHSKGSSRLTIALTVFGALFIFVVTRLI